MTDRTKCPGALASRNTRQPHLFAIARRTVLLVAVSAFTTLSACGGGGGSDDYALSDASQSLVTGKVTVAWDPPVSNEDGSPLTDLAGYRFYYGSKSSAYEHVVDVKDPNANVADLPLPASGTWYISAKSYRSNGSESDLADEIVYESRLL